MAEENSRGVDTSTPTINRILFAICGLAFAAGCLVFAQFTVRLIYMNLTMENVAEHRSFWMFIWAIAFPVAAIVCGFISWICIRKALRD